MWVSIKVFHGGWTSMSTVQQEVAEQAVREWRAWRRGGEPKQELVIDGVMDNTERWPHQLTIAMEDITGLEILGR